MFDAMFIATARAGDSFERPAWLPVLPSYQNPTVEWEGNVEQVARVEFPEGAPILITLVGDVLDADRARFLDHGWRVRPSA
jgi:hypothetical protein